MQIIVGSVLIGLLTLSGIIDFFPILNDGSIALQDLRANEKVAWINSHTPKNSVILNSSYLYHPASIAGRYIFQGWPYFSWSAGYAEDRVALMKRMYESQDPAVFCPILLSKHIDFVSVENVSNDPNLPKINLGYFLSTFTPTYLSTDKTFALFTTSSLCP